MDYGSVPERGSDPAAERRSVTNQSRSVRADPLEARPSRPTPPPREPAGLLRGPRGGGRQRPTRGGSGRPAPAHLEPQLEIAPSPPAGAGDRRREHASSDDQRQLEHATTQRSRDEPAPARRCRRRPPTLGHGLARRGEHAGRPRRAGGRARSGRIRSQIAHAARHPAGHPHERAGPPAQVGLVGRVRIAWSKRPTASSRRPRRSASNSPVTSSSSSSGCSPRSAASRSASARISAEQRPPLLALRSEPAQVAAGLAQLDVVEVRPARRSTPRSMSRRRPIAQRRRQARRPRCSHAAEAAPLPASPPSSRAAAPRAGATSREQSRSRAADELGAGPARATRPSARAPPAAAACAQPAQEVVSLGERARVRGRDVAPAPATAGRAPGRATRAEAPAPPARGGGGRV